MSAAAAPFVGLSGDDSDRLREQLATVGFTVDRIDDRLGPVAHEALDRNETTAAERATRDGGPLETLIRLWLLQRDVGAAELDLALPGLVRPLLAAGFLDQSGDRLRAAVDVRPYGDDSHDWWVVADLTPGLDGARPVVPSDHVLGVNSAATTLAELTVHRSGEAALDLGSGCGLQSLHLSTQSRRVVATDVNPRALAMTRQTARLNDVTVDVREGSLFAPVCDERFDLVVSNPPFVVSPGADAEGLTYRDSGLAGDEICRKLVTQVPAYLGEGGVCQTLVNWAQVRGEDWQDRVGSWVSGSGCDAWVVRREVSDPAAYVEVWLADAGLRGAAAYHQRYDAWLRWFETQGIEGIGFGWVVLRRTETAHPTVRLESWPHVVEQPLGPTVDRWLDRIAWLRFADDAALRRARLRVADEVVQEQVGPPGSSDPEHIVLRQRRGLRRADRVDTCEAGFVSACDGELSVEQIARALATLLSEDAEALAGRLLPRVRQWIEEGYLTPTG